MFQKLSIFSICVLTLPTLSAWALAPVHASFRGAEEEVLVGVFNTGPCINFGPLSFGLFELPAEVSGTISLGEGFPTGGGAIGYGLNEVIGLNFNFGDFTGMNLMAFDMEINGDGSLETLSYAFSPFNTPTVDQGFLEMNGVIGPNHFLVTGTDIASGQTFSYKYSNSKASFTFLIRGDVNVDGFVNLLDVAPFVDRLATGTFQAEADVNRDGVVNLLDVQPFVALLSGG